MTGRQKYGDGLEQLMIQSIQHHLWNMVEQCDGMSVHGFQWHWLLVLFDDIVEDRSSRMNSEVYRDILSAQIQLNAAKLIGWCVIVQMHNDPKHTAKATQEFLKVKRWIFLQWSSQSPDLNLIEHAFHLLKTQLNVERPTNKQQLKSAAVKAKHHKGGNPVSGDVHKFHECLKAVTACKGFWTKY